MRNFPQFVGTLPVCSMLMITTAGCAHDTGTYTTLREARSPDGKMLAQLVQRESHAALSSDTFFAVLSHDRLDEGSLRLAYHEHERPFLDVTKGKSLEMSWINPDQLEIACNNCGLEKIDVMTKRSKEDGVSISYKGFPSGTAYSDK
jgi:hypothetical protein